jgi:hypothetical protein
VGEGVLADDRLVGLDLDSGDEAQELAGVIDLVGLDSGVALEELASDLEGHDDLLHRGIPGPLADAVDRALDLAGAGSDRGQAVGHRETQVVVAMNADHGLVDVGHTLPQVGDEAVELLGIGVADGVGDVDGLGSGLDHRLDHLRQIGAVAAGRILGAELDVGRVSGRVLHRRHRVLQDPIPALAELVLEVKVAGRDESVDPRILSLADRVPTDVDVLESGPGETGDRRAFDLAGDGLNRREVALGSHRKAGLDDVDAQFRELAGHPELLVQVHAAARGLLAVAKRRVENFNDIHV